MSNNQDVQKLNELINDAAKLKNEVSTKSNSFKNFLSKASGYSSVKAHMTDCINVLDKIIRSTEDFIRNYNNMKEVNTIGADRYFHAKANCEAAQRGNIGAAVSKGISDLRELSDTFKNTLFKGMSIIESFEDSIKDQEANKYGRNQGSNNRNANCSDLVNKYRPNGLNSRY